MLNPWRVLSPEYHDYANNIEAFDRKLNTYSAWETQKYIIGSESGCILTREDRNPSSTMKQLPADKRSLNSNPSLTGLWQQLLVRSPPCQSYRPPLGDPLEFLTSGGR